MVPPPVSASHLPTHEELTAHLPWVQALAQRLVDDAQLAEDVAQESLVAALRSRNSLRSTRRFLARVARNLSYLHLRRRARRERREQGAARDEALPSALEDVERESTRALVVQSVQDMPSHYRDVLLLRFFEDLQPRQIAERLGVPVATVKTRLARAQAQLRERLDRMHGGDSRSWLGALAGLLAEGRRSAAPFSRLALGMVALTLVAICWGAVQLWSDGGTAGGPDAPQTSRSESAEIADSTAKQPVMSETAEQEAFAGRTPTSATDTRNPAQPGVLVQGRILDATGRPVAGAILSLPENDQGARIAISDGQGKFSFENHWPGGPVQVRGDRWITVLPGESRGGDPRAQVVVVVAPLRTLRGRVVDAAGDLISGARCTIELPQGFRARFATDLDRSSTARFTAVSGAGGSFSMRAPDLDGVHLIIESPAHPTRNLTIPPAATWVDVLLSERSPTRRQTGRITDGDGAPIPGAGLWVGDNSRDPDTVSDADGGFALDLPVRSTTALTAVDPRSQVRAEFELEVHAGTTLDLKLDTDAVLPELRGIVRGPGDTPLQAVQVWHWTAPDGRCGAATRTDAGGAFALPGVPRQHATLEFRAPGMLPVSRSASEGGNLRMRPAVAVRVSMPTAPEGAWVEAHDGEGRAESLVRMHGSEVLRSLRVPLVGGRSEVLLVDQDRVQQILILVEGRGILAAQELRPVSGQTTQLRF